MSDHIHESRRSSSKNKATSTTFQRKPRSANQPSHLSIFAKMNTLALNAHTASFHRLGIHLVALNELRRSHTMRCDVLTRYRPRATAAKIRLARNAVSDVLREIAYYFICLLDAVLFLLILVIWYMCLFFYNSEAEQRQQGRRSMYRIYPKARL